MFTPALALLLKVHQRRVERSKLNLAPQVKLEDKPSIETSPVSIQVSQIPAFTSTKVPANPKKSRQNPKTNQKSRPVLLSQKRKQRAAKQATQESKPTSEPTFVWKD
jgi:hypothetical protein